MDLDDLLRLFAVTERYLITTHEAPDGDGLGAEYALAASLTADGKDAVVVNSDAMGAKYGFLDARGLIKGPSTEKDIPDDAHRRLLVILDTVPSNLGVLGPRLLSDPAAVVVVDHHEPGDEGGFDGWLVPDASSTCELVFRIIEAMDLPITPDVATALLTGIVYDTGSFVYPKTKAGTFRIAEKLVSLGAVPSDIHTRLSESKSAGALILQSLVTSTMTLYLDDAVAVQVMPRETLIASGASYEESQEIVNIPLQCGKTRVSVFFKEKENGIRRCSLRSKGEVDCVAIARSYGGGGHPTAAGFRFEETFEEIQEKVLAALAPYFS